MISIQLLIDQAKTTLVQHPLDDAHDLTHAEAVWSMGKVITQHINQPINLNALKVACYWHDVLDPQTIKDQPPQENVINTTNFLLKSMASQGLPNEFITLTTNAVRYHQFNDQPINLEGQVLWDADKLEALNPDRWVKAIQAVKDGNMKDADLKSYAESGVEWLKVIRQKFHFPYSLTLFEHRLHLFLKNPAIQQMATKYHLEFKN